ncbi:MAG TPA: hypothetical protein VK826_02945 [Bacteroidia bacterium]|nr:hypothetical protein [Bacteroidia bacterium]
MNKFLSTLLLLFSSGVLFAQYPEVLSYDKNACALRKKQKTESTVFLREWYDNASSSFPDKGRRDTLRVEKYDREGRMIEQLLYDKKEEHPHSYYWYDEKGRIVRTLFCAGDSSNGLYREYYYEDWGDFLFEELEYERTDGEDGLFYLGKFEYDAGHRLIGHRKYFAWVQLGMAMIEEIFKYRYEQNGALIITLHLDGRKEDTIQVDSTFLDLNGLQYRRVEYAYYRDLKTGILAADSLPEVFTTETFIAVSKTTKISKNTGYNWMKKVVVTWEYDSCIMDADGRTIECLFRTDYVYEHAVYFYSDKDEYSHTIVYDPKRSPVYRTRQVSTFRK